MTDLQQESQRKLDRLLSIKKNLTDRDLLWCQRFDAWEAFFTDPQRDVIATMYRKYFNDRTDERATD